jgi:hypothetical protein
MSSTLALLRRAPRPLTSCEFGLPCLASFFGNHWVIEASVRALYPGGKDASPDLAPSSDVATKASELGEFNVVIGEAGGWHLVPRAAPQQDSSPELFAS